MSALRISSGRVDNIAGDLDHILLPECRRLVDDLFAGPVRIERDLKQAGAISQIDEDDAAQIPDAMHPPGNGDRFSCVVGSQCTGETVGPEMSRECVRLGHQNCVRSGIVAGPPIKALIEWVEVVKLKCDIHLVEGVKGVSEGVEREKNRTNLLDLLPSDAEAALKSFAAANGQPAYRATQVMKHLWNLPRGELR